MYVFHSTAHSKTCTLTRRNRHCDLHQGGSSSIALRPAATDPRYRAASWRSTYSNQLFVLMVDPSFLALSLPTVVFFGGIQFLALPKTIAATGAAPSGGLRPGAQRKALSPELAVPSDQQPGVRGESTVGGQESRIETQAKFDSQLPSEFPQCPYVIATEEEALSRSKLFVQAAAEYHLR